MLFDWTQRVQATLREQRQDIFRDLKRESADMAELRKLVAASHRQDARMREDHRMREDDRRRERLIAGIAIKVVLMILTCFVGLLAIMEKLVRK